MEHTGRLDPGGTDAVWCAGSPTPAQASSHEETLGGEVVCAWCLIEKVRLVRCTCLENEVAGEKAYASGVGQVLVAA